MNIQIPELEHKYINLYDTQEEYEADKERYEEVNYSIVKSPQATEDNYSEFQYSTRTTNNDNQVMAKYWDSETPNLWAGLKIIWGYFGWQETTIELLGETLTGGNFYNAGKNMTTVLSIPDGDTLQHIDNFTYNLYDKTTRIFPIKEIQQFDTSNIKSAMNFVFPGLSNDCTLKQLEWNSVLRAVMNYIKSKVSTICIGLSASMAAFLLSSGEKKMRYILPNSEVMIHQPLGGAQGQATEIKIAAERILRLKEKLNKILSENTGQSLEKIQNDTERDYFLSADEALEYGIIDKILN